MKKDLKDILLKDICARLPYGVKASVYSYWNESYLDDSIVGVDIEEDEFFCSIVPGVRCPIIKTKPYLLPLSSMTEEQKYDFYCRFIENDCDFDDFKEFYLDNGMWHKLLTSIDDCDSVVDWFHKNHFDYRNLIPKGLAIDATNLNIY